MSLKSYPPHVALGSKPLSVDAAQKLIASYLESSESSAHLHPDALLSTSDVQFAPAGGAHGGIILHNLRRVDAGLQGEILKPEVPQVSDDMVLDGKIDETEKRMQTEQEYQEDGVEVGELGQRANFVADGGDIPAVVAEDSEHAPGKTKIDKEARKKAKKDRERQEKLEKEARRKRNTEA